MIIFARQPYRRRNTRTKVRFGETAKPARETRALPGSLRSPEETRDQRTEVRGRKGRKTTFVCFVIFCSKSLLSFSFDRFQASGRLILLHARNRGEYRLLIG